MAHWLLVAMVVALGAGSAPAAALAAAADTRIYVAADGNDSWSGALMVANASASDGPVASLTRAQALVRAAKALQSGGQASAPIRVLIKPGTYRLSTPLLFGPADAGTERAPVSYEAITAGTVTLSGGVALVQRAALREGSAAVFDLPPAAADTWRGGGQLFVNGQRATLARQPKAGQAWFVQRGLPLNSEPEAQRGHEAFVASPEASSWLARLSAPERARAIVQVMHSWNSSQHRLADAVPTAGAVRIAPRARWAFLSTGPSQRWFVENIPSALTDGGEWVATDAEVRYVPTPAQALRPLEAVLPVLERLLVVHGDAAAGQWVEHLSFQGLRFAHTRYLMPAAGFSDPQAAIGVGAAVEIDGARHLVFDQCSFGQTGSYAVWFRQSVTDSRITGSSFDDLGGGGVQVGVARAMPGEPSATARNVIQHNRIGNTGRVFPGAVGIWVGQAYDSVVSNNEIHDTSYTGISVGWTWGFGPAASGRHTISNNLLVNIGGGRLSDQGGIYTLGTLTGTTISGNVIRNVRAYPGYGPGTSGGAWGIYNDEGSSGVLVENNIVVGTDSGGYHLHKGRAIIVRGNLFASGTTAEVRLTQLDERKPQALLQSNILIPLANQPFDALATGPDLAFSGNLVSDALVVGPLDLAKCGTGCARGHASVAADASARGLRFAGLDADTAARLAATVAAAGIAPALRDIGNAAKLGDAGTVHTRASAEPIAAPIALVVDMATARLGTRPDGLRYAPADAPGAIGLVENRSAPGGRCILFKDSAVLARRFDPHAFANLNHDRGTSTGSFAILIDADTDFVHEWRDNSSPYLTGPSLRITAAGVTVNGRQIAPAVVGQWLQVRVAAALGPAAGTWSLEVNTGGAGAASFTGLAPVSPQWRRLNYVGYISNAVRETSFCLAAVGVANTAAQN